jgi:tetratricopeptide (TPR) repeat protein
MLILTYLLALLGVTLAVLAQMGFTYRDPEGSRTRQWLRKSKWRLFVPSIAVCGTAVGIIISQHTLSLKPVLELSRGPGGELILTATLSGFERELKTTGTARATEAANRAAAGERAFAETRYRDAARNYQKSIDLVPTMPGYLNLGVALLHASDGASAKKVLFDGVEIARRKKERAFDAAFIGAIAKVFASEGVLWKAADVHQISLRIARGICDPLGEGAALAGAGWVSYKRGNVPEALELYEQALRVFKRNGIRPGQAMTLLAIGGVQADKGRLEEASQAYHAAREIARRAGDPLRQAAALYGIGVVHAAQGRADDARASYTAALEIYRTTGHLLGQAETLSATGTLYATQGKAREALEVLNEARAIYAHVGGVTTQLRVVEEQINRANAGRHRAR